MVHKPSELSLAHQGVLEVHASELDDLDLTEVHGALQPQVLLITVLVLGGSHGVGDALDGVHNGAGQIIAGVSLVPRA